MIGLGISLILAIGLGFIASTLEPDTYARIAVGWLAYGILLTVTIVYFFR